VIKRLRIEIEGRVQGVGFRPTVYRHATACGVAGRVENSTRGVVIEAEGTEEALARFHALLRAQPPSQARVRSVTAREVPPAGDTTFAIAASVRAEGVSAQLPPDLATCEDCRAEILDPANRRHGYAFTNCTNCGPRFTIIAGLPYDRERTTMAPFAMCARCRAEYADPADRRFDAQPNACPQCGPKLRLIDAQGRELPGDPISETARRLRAGEIGAIKGLGGFHLACLATEDAPLRRLRERKARPAKALAVMFRDLAELRRHCRAGDVEVAELTSSARPIVVLDRPADSPLSALISPDTADVGAFLPYTPLHHLLLARVSPLVMSSANRAEEPIARDAAELDGILGPIADFALDHDRPILRRCDDSVLRVLDGNRMFIRRSRGFTPNAIALPLDGPSVVAVGADLKNTFAFTRGAEVFLSQHIGDMAEYSAQEFHRQALGDMLRLFEVRPEVVAHDMHPDYSSTRRAEELAGTIADNGRGTTDDGRRTQPGAVVLQQRTAVQHHHAHVAACMAEHGLTERVIGVALDGTGYGPDGTIWGGEFLIADLRDFRRAARLAPLPMPGGEEAVRNPARMGLAALFAWGNPRPASPETAPGFARLASRFAPGDAARLWHMLARGLRCPLTSSAGRLFDAVAALVGLGEPISYEGQAAIRLEALAQAGEESVYAFDLHARDALRELSLAPAVRGIVAELAAGVAPSIVAARFHNTVALGVAETCAALRERERLDAVALSGGVFQNRRLLRSVQHLLERRGFRVYSHCIVPPNDGGIALGQAAVALARAGRPE
jgi:hydrogenase maturation protein HypF